MELANIEKLVEKYQDAKTTLQEEQTLREYFLSENVAPHLQEYSYMFGYFNSSKDETYTKTITLKSKKPQKKRFNWLQVAASVVLLVSMYVGYGKYEEQQQREQLAQVTKALKLLSTNLNKGNEAVATLHTYDNTVNKIFKTK